MHLSSLRPRYLYRRLYDMYFQRRHPETPWISPAAILVLDNWLRKEDRGFEWGSGRSTTWLSQHVSHMISVEDSPDYHAVVQKKLQEKGVAGKVDYRLVPCDLAEQAEPESHPYADAILEFPDSHFDFIFVDGKIRVLCMERALAKLKPGGLLVLDNANRYVPNPFLGEFSTIHEPCTQPPTPRWGRVLAQLEVWRRFNTTNGIWDTRFWVKPGGG